MKLTIKLGIAAVMILLAACATGPRKVTMTEVMAAGSRVITAATDQPAPTQLEKLYTQPANKSELCKLPITQDLLEGKNFRAYWDGECKDGYAYGLGRSIALSDTHHLEAITVYSGEGDFSGQPWRLLDYVQNYSAYGVSGAVLPATTRYNEVFTHDFSGFFIRSVAGAMDNAGSLRYLESSPFSPVSVTVNQPHGARAYVLVDYSALPATSDQPQMVLFEGDPATKKPIGFRIVRYRNGVIQHQKLASDGQSVAELVRLPSEYVGQLLEKINEAQAAVQQVGADAAKAQQMERGYLYMACAADYRIKGVPASDMEIARHICTWRDQWKEPYAKAENKYKQEMEHKRKEVAQAEQQRAYIAAQQAQAAAAQNAAFSTSMNQMNQTLQQQNSSTMQQINQMNQQLQYQNTQMMQSWTPQQEKITVCRPVGSQIICR